MIKIIVILFIVIHRNPNQAIRNRIVSLRQIINRIKERDRQGITGSAGIIGIYIKAARNTYRFNGSPGTAKESG